MTGNKNMQYYIVFDANGKCTKLLATNGTYKIEATAAEINIEQLGETYKADETSDKFTLVLDATDNSAKITGAVKSSN